MDSKTETVSDFKKDIAEVGDIMIADFIGKQVWDKELMKDGRDQQWDLPMCIGYYPTAKTMKFKTSWDWLIPVVHKIRKTNGDEDLKTRISAALLLAELNMLYAECIRFIKFNSQSPDTIK